MSMSAPAKAARTPRRRLKSTSILWAGISRPPCSRFPWERKDRLHQNYLRRKANGKQKEWEERYNAKRKAQVEAAKAAIRAEDMEKGIFTTVSQLPRQEPRKATVSASAAV